ncbi:ThiF family adenylyltransferase [Nonomuraea sp. H19]|uniref:ThiF family adenylyltransferase n=1 Tax=Nonomuraea sp. H19 TaxID=3452206 RepID=UPI003F8ACBC0
MRPRVKPALRRILRDEQTLQYGVHPLRAVVLTGLTRSVRRWIEGLDGTRDLDHVLDAARAAGLDEFRARSLLDQLAAQGALHDAATSPAPLRDLTLAERDRLRPDLDALDLASATPEGGIGLLARRRQARVRVYGAGRVGAQIVALLAAGGVGRIRVIDSGRVRPSDITPGGLTWSEVGLTREAGAVAVARRITSGGHAPGAPANAGNAAAVSAPGAQPTAMRKGKGAQQTTARNETRAQETAAARNRDGGRPATGQTDTGGRPAVRQTDARGRPTVGQTGAGERPTVRRTGDGGRQADRRAAAGRTGPEGAGASAKPAPRQAARGDGFGAGAEELVRPSAEVLAGGPYLGDKSERPDLVIIAPVGPQNGVLANELNSLGIPHLLAAAFEGHGMVGPLVLPGETACLHCLDLTRRDYDAAWPIVTARLGGYPPGEIACDTTLATLVAAEATGHALAHLDGRESAVTNGTMDVTPDWRWHRQSWSMHPQCRCMRNNPYSLRMVMSPNRD